MCVSCRFPRLKLQGKAKVGDAGRQVGLQQHVLALDVPERQRGKHIECDGPQCVGVMEAVSISSQRNL